MRRRRRDPMDYDELERALLDGGRSSTDARGHTVDALTDVATGVRALRAVRHPLGFLCLPVLRDGPRGICVHLFDPGYGAEPDTAAWHAHSWELRSHVLYGRVANLPVRVSAATARPTHRIFEVRSGPGGVDDIVPTTELVRGEPGRAHISGRGETYTLTAGEFHATSVADPAPAATLVLGRSVPGGADLSLGPLDGPARTMTRGLCDEQQTTELVRTALRRIDGRISA
ncbi:hypothetical protein ACGF8B_14045 [Streptomyces sp. NPDC047917]|uniref:hypothetical protein n=1 Tax=Streptomyces sp. NPDC047917 TaxID=3365491 RepID=UPI00371C50C4